MTRCRAPGRASNGRGGLIAVLLLLVLAAAADAVDIQGEKQAVYLYFADPGSPFLVAEARAMVVDDDPLAQGRRLVTALIEGPTRGYLATIPAGTRLRNFFLLADGTAVADFSTELRDNQPGGCRMEELALFSIVNTLVLNVQEIERVRILIDGIDIPTLAGHLSLEYPLTADMLLTR